MVQAHTYKVLLFGSGMMTPPLIDYLCKYGDTHITVASNIIEDAQKLCQRHPQHMAALLIDVFDVSNPGITTSLNQIFIAMIACASRSSHPRKEPRDLIYSSAPSPKGFANRSQAGCERHNFKLYLSAHAGAGC